MRHFLLLLLLGTALGTGTAFAQKKGSFARAEHHGFSIPQIDLNDQTGWQTVVSKQPDIYMGHPTSVLLDDGKTMIMMYLDKHGKGNLMWRRSKDAGKTWSEDLPLPEGWDEAVVIDDKSFPAWYEVPTLYKVEGPDGVQRLIVYTSGRSAFPARYAVSEDQGKTWSKLKDIVAGGAPIQPSVVLFSDMIRLTDGRYRFTYHEPGRVYTVTTNDGMIFDKPVLAATIDGGFPCEACFVRSPDGKKIALLMRENNRIYNSLISFSTDEGESWSEPVQMRDSLTGDRHTDTYLPDGRLFISFRDRGAGSPTIGDWVGWVGTFDDLVEGKEGQYRVRLKENFNGNDCAYPTHHLLPDGTVFAATYGGWEKEKPNYLLGFHFRIEDLDALVNIRPPRKQGQ